MAENVTEGSVGTAAEAVGELSVYLSSPSDGALQQPGENVMGTQWILTIDTVSGHRKCPPQTRSV